MTQRQPLAFVERPIPAQPGGRLSRSSGAAAHGTPAPRAGRSDPSGSVRRPASHPHRQLLQAADHEAGVVPQRLGRQHGQRLDVVGEHLGRDDGFHAGERIADAARFDPDRDGLGQHLAFGLGMHACIGNPLARMEAVIATQVLADHVESLTVLAPESLRYNASFMVRGLQQLPVRVARRATD